MSKTCNVCLVALLVFLLFPNFYLTAALHGGGQGGGGLFPVPAGKHGTVVKKEQRWSVVTAEDGEISSVKVSDGKNGFYHLQFITMEPNSLFLPVHLHSDMVFYVDSGNGTLSWVDLEKDEDKLKQVDLKAGDVYRLRTGSFFYLQSNLESDRRKLRINAIFSDSKEQILEGSSFGAYSSVSDLLLGFDDKVLQAALNVDEGVIQELKSGGKQPMIVHGVSKAENVYEVHYKMIMRAFLGSSMPNDLIDVSKNKHKNKNKDKPYNIQEAKHDVDNCNGWSLVVTSKQLKALKDSDFGVFYVNLTIGSMMGPHWNPLTAEIAVVLRGRGMVRVVCPSSLDETECKNSRFRVEEGDVFVVPRYHPMAQISFNNESFVFMGFTTTQKNNHPQYLVGTASVFQALDKRVLATSLGVSNTTMDEILTAQREAIILECTSCAEEEEMLMEEEMERQEEERRREEEEAAKEWEEQEAKRRQEEEARRQREEEEAAAKQREEEAAKQREQEAEAARQRQQEEAAARQREQEEAAEASAKQREEEAARQREQEAAARKREEEAARERQQEEAEAAAAEDAARQRQQEQEEAARQQKDEAARQREQEAAAAARQQREAEAARQQEEDRRRRQHEKEAGRGGGEGEAASMEEGEMARRQREDEEAARRREAGGRGGGTSEV
uniref:vicilin-like seed storage protein At2g18540 n=1 Tax=Erigeron canadensis TaxID=72917 RepID=UPI001CB98F73|nr:vicilin-like seed storage protein At2g18540 [Erigeron canadensis]